MSEPAPEEAGDMSIMQRGLRKCKQVACDITLYTVAGATVGTVIGGVVAYPAWSNAHQINKNIEGAMKAREEIIKTDPSAQFGTSMPIFVLASQRNDSYRFAVNVIQAAPVIGGIVGFCIGSIVGTVRLCRSVCHLHVD